MGNYLDALRESIEFENFGSLIGDTIFTLRDIRRGYVNKNKIDSAIMLCETIMKGHEVSKRVPQLWGESDAYKKYKLIYDSREYLEKEGFDLEAVMKEIGELKVLLGEVLKGKKALLKRDKINKYQIYLSKIGIHFLRAADVELMRAKALKGSRD